jgi:hypothetical protein
MWAKYYSEAERKLTKLKRSARFNPEQGRINQCTEKSLEEALATWQNINVLIRDDAAVPS